VCAAVLRNGPLSVCLSRRSTAAAASGWFAAECPAGAAYQSIATDAGSVMLWAEDEASMCVCRDALLGGQPWGRVTASLHSYWLRWTASTRQRTSSSSAPLIGPSIPACCLPSDDVLVWLYVCIDVQIVCVRSSWCQRHPKTPANVQVAQKVVRYDELKMYNFFWTTLYIANAGGRSVRWTCDDRTKLIALATVDVPWTQTRLSCEFVRGFHRWVVSVLKTLVFFYIAV